MEEKKSTILFIIDINKLSYGEMHDEYELFNDAINNKKHAENADEINIVLTNFKYSLKETLKGHARTLRRLLNSNVRISIYQYTKTSNNEIGYESSCNKYTFIQRAINEVSKKYKVVYTALMQNISNFSVDEEEQAKEQIETINEGCKFELLLSSNAESDYRNVYNDHLVISEYSGLKGYAHSINTKIFIDNGIKPNMRYHEFYKKDKENSEAKINGENAENKSAMLIIIDSDDIYDFDINDEIKTNLIAKKEEVGADEIYIIVSNSILTGYDIKDYLKQIVYEFSYILKEKAKYFIKEYIFGNNSQNSVRASNDNASFLDHALQIKNSFAKRKKVNFIYTAYFTNASHYKNISGSVKERMRNSNIEFFAHSAKYDIEGVIRSSDKSLDALNRCLKSTIKNGRYTDENNRNDEDIIESPTDTDCEVTAFYCDIAGTIDDICGQEHLMETLNNKLIELKQALGSKKILFCLITNDDNLNYLTKFIDKLSPALNDDIIFTNHFFSGGALIDGQLIENILTMGTNKFDKISYHVKLLMSKGYNINHVYFADDSIYSNRLQNIQEYLPNDIVGHLLVPGVRGDIQINDAIMSWQTNIRGLIDCIDECIELEKDTGKVGTGKGEAYTKKYKSKNVEDDDDDDDYLPF